MTASAPNPTIIPTLRYRDARKAIAWLRDTFGFHAHLVVPGEGDAIRHSQLTLGHGMIMLGSARDGEEPETSSVLLVLADPDAAYARAQEMHAEIVVEIEDQGPRGRFFSCKDPEGHTWNVGEYDPFA